MRIPFGETVSYAELARRIGKPRAVRAVAQACGKNPLPIVIPCHRVIRSDGTIGGYSGGIRWKQRLLRFERELL
jgi:O-6-methylguanine DNA methyltransferase